MDKTTKDAINTVLDEYEITDKEKYLLDYADTPRTSEINHTRVISTYLLVK